MVLILSVLIVPMVSPVALPARFESVLTILATPADRSAVIGCGVSWHRKAPVGP